MATQTKLKEAPAPSAGGLYAALLEAQRAVQPVAKASKNAHHGYNYASAEDIVRASRDVLLAAGLVARRGAWAVSHGEDEPTVLVEFSIHHPASGEDETDKIEWPAIPGKGRPPDKALAAALTSAEGYWLTGLLLIPRGDGEEMDKRDDTGYKPAEPARRYELKSQASDSPQSPAQQEPPRHYGAAPADEPVMGFASGKGMTAGELDERNLSWYLRAYRENVNDPSKAQYQPQNMLVLDALEREAAGRSNKDEEVAGDDGLTIRDKLTAGFNILAAGTKRPQAELLAELGQYVHAKTGEKVIPMKVTDITRSKNAAQYVWNKLERELLKVTNVDTETLGQMLRDEAPF